MTGNPLRDVDPFGYWPGRASALIERSNVDEARLETAPANYVFHTTYVFQSPGPFMFLGTFGGLQVVEGEVEIRIHELGEDENQGAQCIATEVFSLTLLQNGESSFKISAIAFEGRRYALVGQILGNLKGRADHLSLQIDGEASTANYRRALVEARETVFGQTALFHGIYELRLTEPTLADPVSQTCTVPQFAEPVYQAWLDKLKRPMHHHRKQWEFVYILQALEHYGVLRSGSRGLGFGVGEEPLPAVMAARGCHVTATDLPSDDTRVADWNGSNQHSSSISGLMQPSIVSNEVLAALVEFKAVDMTDIPDDLVGYDFTWSSCALEHVGSIARGLDFIERSIACLRPGGIAVHTTELNLLSNDATIDQAGTVLFRRRDFEEICTRLTLRGHQVMPLNFMAGSSPLDDHIDVPPYSSNDHFKLLMSRYLTTSFGIIIRRGQIVKIE